jgi:SAM-dependent methyltransferase
VERTRISLREAWDAEAENWVRWAREPGHDSYWRFHRDRFLELLPPPGRLTVDVGCGEGRFPRDLKALGHRVVGIDGSERLIDFARRADADGDYRVADAARLPLNDRSADLVTAFMSLHDIDDMDAAVREAARILATGGRVCAALVHPINSAGRFAEHTPAAPFVIRESYFEQRRYADTVERDGLTMTFSSVHRPMEAIVAAFESAGLLIERMVELGDPTDRPGDRWTRIPLFLHLRARAAPAIGISPRREGCEQSRRSSRRG